MKIPYRLIETEADLKELLPELSSSQIMGVDLEADSLFHYREKVCLLQISLETFNLVIDPLSVRDLSPLQPVFADDSIRKVLHGADYDIRSLFRDFSIEIKNLFDTQLACRFLGVLETGLDAVLRQRFNLVLEKSFQKKDWSQRPLPREMLDYAAVDVQYLIPLARSLEEDLRGLGRLEWVEEECAILTRVRANSSDRGPLFLRVKGADRLDRRSLAVLEALLHFRERRAEKLDRPPFKILQSESLFKIAEQKPVTLSDLEESKILNERQISLWGNSLLRSVEQGLERPEANLPLYPRGRKPRTAPEVRKYIEALKTWRKKAGEKLALDPSILLNNSTIQVLAAANPRSREDLDRISGLREWQKNHFGGEMIEALDGSRAAEGP
jgi:ribonuclease D